MKGKLLQVSYILIFFGLGFYLGTVSSSKKGDSARNAFISEANKPDKIVKENFFDIPLFHFSGKNYSLKDLPIPAQQELARDLIIAQRKASKLIKSIVTQSVSSNKKNGLLDFKKIPDVTSFYNNMVSDAEVDELYKKNIQKFAKDHDPTHIKLNIRVQLLARKVTEHSEKVISDLYDKKTYFIYNNLPSFPKEWLQLEEFPRLGTPEIAKYRVDIFMNYLCEDCPKLAEQVGDVFKAFDPKQIILTMVPVSSKSLSVDYYVNKSALCFYEQDKSLFWNYNIKLLSRAKNLKLLRDDNLDRARVILDEILSSKAFDMIKKDEIFSCIKNEKRGKDGKYLNPVVRRLRVAKEKFQFLTVFPLPVILINGKLIMNELSLNENMRLGVSQSWL
jgi:hypothetical protein